MTRYKRIPSVLQDGEYCYLSQRTDNLDPHHIFFGSDRNMSEKYGLWVWLNHDYHFADSPNKTPHNDRETDLFLKRIAQMKFESEYGHEEFMRVFGWNYL